MRKILSLLFLITTTFLFVGCGSDDTDVLVTKNELSWKVDGVFSYSEQVSKEIQPNSLGIDSDDKFLYLFISKNTELSVGSYTHSTIDFNLGFDYSGSSSNDYKFTKGTFTITNITSTYVEGTFTGYDAVKLEGGNPLPYILTEGKFKIYK